VILKFNKTRSGIRTAKTGQTGLANQTLRFYQRDLYKTYSIYIQVLCR
jgi:hypothetical protein